METDLVSTVPYMKLYLTQITIYTLFLQWGRAHYWSRNKDIEKEYVCPWVRIDKGKDMETFDLTNVVVLYSPWAFRQGKIIFRKFIVIMMSKWVPWRLKSPASRLLFNHVFRRRSKKTSKPRVTGLCEGNPPVTGGFPSQRPVTRKIVPFDDVIVSFYSGSFSWTLPKRMR